jgi:hypothetical protein
VSNIGPNNGRPSWQSGQPAQRKTTGQSGATENVGVTGNSGGTNSPNPTSSAMAQANLSASAMAGLNPKLSLAATQLLQLLKSLLQMPREMAQLMALLADADPASAQAMLQQLLASETPVPLEQLQQLLLSHADAAQEKLMKLLQTTAMSPGGQSGQMGELLGTLSELVGKAKESPTQALHSTITLYLPHLPIQPPQAFSLRYENPGGGDGEAASGEGQSSEQLCLFIETMTLGRFRITLEAQSRAPLEAIVSHEPQAAPFEAEIVRQTDELMGGPGRLALIFLEKPGKQVARQSAQLPTSETEAVQVSKQNATAARDGKQSVALHPSGGISMAALYGAYALIRVIFEVDSQNKLHQTRAALIELN